MTPHGTEKRAGNGPGPTLVFCLPHAGGSAAFYQPLAAHLSSRFRLVPLELPGKGLRAREQLCTDFERLADDAAAQIYATLRADISYALFGHSMGALLAWHLAHRMCPAPMHLFLSSPALFFSQGTQSLRGTAPYHTLPSEKLLAKLHDMGGLPPGEASPELLRYIEPIIRADFAALNGWSPPLRPPLSIPVTLFLGQEEQRTFMAHWAGRTCGPLAAHTLPGGHFYLLHHWERLAMLMADSLPEPTA